MKTEAFLDDIILSTSVNVTLPFILKKILLENCLQFTKLLSYASFSDELFGVASTGLDQYASHSASSMPKSQDKETYIIFIHALKNGLFRIMIQGQTGR